MKKAGRKGRAGFSLLEVMIAVAILAGALTWMVVGISRNIRAENHAKLMTVATFLSREKMIETEDELYEKGFGEFEKELAGNFEDRGFERFTWKVVVDKVELPSSDQIQTVLTKAQEAKSSLTGESGGTPEGVTSPGGNSPVSAGAATIGSQFGIVKDVLEQGIRRVTVKVEWQENRRPQEMSLVAYYTDPRRVDQAIQVAPADTGAPTTGTSAKGAH
jgi:general secretion pathway protein I